MSSVLAPFGMRPINNRSGFVRPTAYAGGLSAAYNTSLYRGTPVLMATTGVLNVAANAGDMLGVFAGVSYTPTGGRAPAWSPYWPASTAFVAGSLVAYVWDDPATVFEVQCEGSLALTSRGDQANFASTSGYAVGDGSTITGNSSMAISSTLAGAGVQGMLRILDIGFQVDNDWGDSYTIVQVQMARSQYVANKVAI